MNTILKSKRTRIALILLVVVIIIGTPIAVKSYQNLKQEQFLNNAEQYIKDEAEDYNKTIVDADKIEVRREGNVIIYTQNYSFDQSVSEMVAESESLGDEGVEVIKDYAKNIRQAMVDTASYYYDEIVKEFGDDYEFYIRSEKSQKDELFLITQYGENGYEFQYDRFDELGY